MGTMCEGRLIREAIAVIAVILGMIAGGTFAWVLSCV